MVRDVLLFVVKNRAAAFWTGKRQFREVRFRASKEESQ